MSLNIYRLCGDMSHVLSKILLLWQLHKAHNARGISLKTQEIYLVVFVFRYLDLFTTFYSVYNSVLKIFYISISACTIYMLKYSESISTLYNFDQDSFPHWKVLLLPSMAFGFLAQVYNEMSRGKPFTMLESLWLTSIILESVAIIPQLLVLRRYRLVENLTGKFMLFLGSYRALYIANWIHRSHTEPHYRHHPEVYLCGVVQTLLYADFFFQYYRSKQCCGVTRHGDEDDITDDNESDLIFEETVELRRSQVRDVVESQGGTEALLDSSPSSMDKAGLERRSNGSTNP